MSSAKLFLEEFHGLSITLRAFERIEKLLSSQPQLASQHEMELNRATVLFANGDYKMANQVLNQILEKLPK